MGFFNAMGKVLSGKPVFEPGQQDGQPGSSKPVAQPLRPEDKVVPVVRFGRIENQTNGQRLDVYADVRNDSDVPIFLDWVALCGVRRQLDVQLRAGEERQLIVYSGALLANLPGGYAEVQYRTAQDGDYFIDYHEVRCDQGGEEGYRITQLLQRGPVKDV